jgi:hypothetical protein
LIRQSTSFLVIAVLLFFGALLIQILVFETTNIVIHVILIASASLAMFTTTGKDSHEVPPIAFPCGILIMMVTLFIGVAWGLALGITHIEHEEYAALFVLVTVLGGILTFIGGLMSRWEGEGRVSGFPEW